MPGPGRKPATDATLRMPPCGAPGCREGEREIGQRAHVEIDHGELLGAVERAAAPIRPKPALLTTISGSRSRAASCLGDVVRRARAARGPPAERAGAAGPRCDRVGQRRERLLAPRHQNELVAVGGKPMCERGADAGRRAGDQRDGRRSARHGSSVPRWPAPPAGAARSGRATKRREDPRRARSGCPRTR